MGPRDLREQPGARLNPPDCQASATVSDGDLFHGFLDNGAAGQAFYANEPPGAARGWLAHKGYACPAHCQGTFAA